MGEYHQRLWLEGSLRPSRGGYHCKGWCGASLVTCYLLSCLSGVASSCTLHFRPAIQATIRCFIAEKLRPTADQTCCPFAGGYSAWQVVGAGLVVRLQFARPLVPPWTPPPPPATPLAVLVPPRDLNPPPPPTTPEQDMKAQVSSCRRLWLSCHMVTHTSVSHIS
jgi:hypothetical protein